MKNLSAIIFVLVTLLPTISWSQNDCEISALAVNDVHSCTNTNYIYDLSVSIENPISDEFKIYYKELPNGNWTYAGNQSYQSPSFSINARRNAFYAVYLFDTLEASCFLRDTLPPQTCMSPCMADSLEITTVSCYPGSNEIEIRFDYPEYDFNGAFLYEVYDDTNQIDILWMAPWGKITLPSHYEGDTIRLCQIDDSLCCKEFIVPACDNEVCPIAWAASAVLDSCVNGKVNYQLNVEHSPALGNRYTELEVFDETGQFIQFEELASNETDFTIEVDASDQDRMFTICDFYQVCCVEVLIPAVACDSLVSSARSLPAQSAIIFPNPAEDYINLSLPNKTSTGQAIDFRIIDFSSRAVKSGTIFSSRADIFIGDLIPGHYLIELNTDSNLKYKGHFIRVSD